MKKRLYKSRNDKKIDGVCAGIAEYFDIDPTLIRLVWAFAVLCVGTGIWAYIIAAIVMPRNPE
ncbi:MAG: PspC domain-containing protein [Clostridia bacterium]|nr:PspC domain-containing protein [Clostridia bacterium]MBR5632940.1 PspC domain-containing protein [Clostridia bacterium]